MIRLAQILDDPSLMARVDRAEIPRLYAECAAAGANLLALAMRPPAVPDEPEDDLVNVEHAARLLGVPKTHVQRHSRRYPFYRKIGGSARYSRKGIARWLETRRK